MQFYVLRIKMLLFHPTLSPLGAAVVPVAMAVMLLTARGDADGFEGDVISISRLRLF